MTAIDTARSITSDNDDGAVSLAARLCWHAFRICRAMAASLDDLQDDLAEISAHCDALIQMAIDLDRRNAEHEAGRIGGRP